MAANSVVHYKQTAVSEFLSVENKVSWKHS